jgi:hypothetical protein
LQQLQLSKNNSITVLSYFLVIFLVTENIFLNVL